MCVCHHSLQQVNSNNMSYQRLLTQRQHETQHIWKKFKGDRTSYNRQKQIQEFFKCCRQNAVSKEKMLQQVRLHDERFPTWNDIADITDKFCSKTLLSASGHSIEPKHSVVLPIECSNNTDMYKVLQMLLCEDEIGVQQLHVTCSYDGVQTLKVPHKAVIFQHISGIRPMVEALKHQPRDLSPMTISSVLGLYEIDSKRSALITDKLVSHSRYLHKDFKRIQFHNCLPRHNKDMRMCYIIEPDTISTIIACVNDKQFILSKATEFDKMKLTPKCVLGCLQGAHVLLSNK